MHWTHHVPDEAKPALLAAAPAVALPALPVFDAAHLAPDEGEAAEVDVPEVYAASLTCVSGHNNTGAFENDAAWPHWPDEATYNATGFGPYPFWRSGSGSVSKTGAALRVWWSHTQASERVWCVAE